MGYKICRCLLFMFAIANLFIVFGFFIFFALAFLDVFPVTGIVDNSMNADSLFLATWILISSFYGIPKIVRYLYRKCMCFRFGE